jgi:hypothetical protein
MRSQFCFAYALLASFVVSEALAQSSETTVTSAEGIVLLHNGQTLKGHITRTGDYYLVTRGVTSVLRLPAVSVEIVCSDLEELYQYKKSQLERGSCAGHVDLARWCLRHDLTARAADQTLAAFALDSSHSGLGTIERRLLATERPAADVSAVTIGARVVPTFNEIEQTIAELPVGAVQQFVTSVQPLLINRCATNGCHGPRSESDFRLLRPNTRQAMSRRMTQRNLFSSLEYIDRGNSHQSKLLTIAKAPHGGGAAVFSEAEWHQVQVLEKWVAGLASQPTANLPASVAKPPAFLLQTRAESIARFLSGISTDETSPATTPPEAVQRVNRGEEYQPRDPFDPEIFNRRFQRNASDAQK